MTDEEIKQYLIQNDSYLSYEQIEKRTGVPYEKLKEIYWSIDQKERIYNNQNTIKMLAHKTSSKSGYNRIGYHNQRNVFLVNLPNARKTGFKNIENALQYREDCIQKLVEAGTHERLYKVKKVNGVWKFG